MKYFVKLSLIGFLLSTIAACGVEGDEICGTWYTNGDLGKMKIEIEASSGTFVGYLLEQEKNGKMVELGPKKENLIFKGLRFKDDKYLGGTFLQNPKGNSICGFKMTYYTQDKTQMRAAHTCDKINRLEFFNRNEYPPKPYIDSKVNTISLDKLLKANPNNKKN